MAALTTMRFTYTHMCLYPSNETSIDYDTMRIRYERRVLRGLKSCDQLNL